MRLSKELIEKIHDITLTDYGFNENGETDKWDILVEDLLVYYEDLQEEYFDYQEKVRDRYEG